MSQQPHETPGDTRDSERPGPFYPVDTLAIFDLASEAIREYQRLLEAGAEDNSARRQAAQVGEGLNQPQQATPHGLEPAALADEAIGHYLKQRNHGLNRSAARTEAAIDTATAHAEPVEPAERAPDTEVADADVGEVSR